MAETCRSTAQFKIKWNFCEAIYITYYILVISKARGAALIKPTFTRHFTTLLVSHCLNGGVLTYKAYVCLFQRERYFNLVEVLRYNPGGHVFNSRWFHYSVSLT
jgi:hypothetical protein